MFDKIAFFWDIQWSLVFGISYVNDTAFPESPWYTHRFYLYLGPLTLIWLVEV